MLLKSQFGQVQCADCISCRVKCVMNSIIRKYCRAAEMLWPPNLVLQIEENMYVGESPPQMSHQHYFDIFFRENES